MDVITLFLIFFILLMLSVPIGYAIGIATLITLISFSNIPITMIAQNAVAGVDSFPLLAIPFFMLATIVFTSFIVQKYKKYSTFAVWKL